MLRKFIVYIVSLLSTAGYAQNKLVLNGAYINITNNATVVIQNENTDAIIRNAGHIISEGENNIVKWLVANQTGTYTVPFGYSNTDYIPLTFTKNAGVGSGVIDFATYKTPTWLNSAYLPTGVLHVNDALGNDNSSYMIDRFWKLDANGYTTKPDLSNLTFTYIDVEHSVVANNITETSLSSQRYNTPLDTWVDFLPSVSLNTGTNTAIIPSVPSADFFTWWTLVDLSTPLPINLIAFKGKCNGEYVLLNWSTVGETEGEYYTLEKSTDAVNWKAISVIQAKLLHQNDYSFEDRQVLNKTYYRLRFTDKAQNNSYSPVIAVSCGESVPEIIIYPNPNQGVCVLQNAIPGSEISIKNMLGQKLYTFVATSSIQHLALDLPEGMYILETENIDVAEKQIKIIIQR